MSCTDCPDPRNTTPHLEYLGWRIFYDDLSVYCSKEHQWKKAPEDGVLCVMVYGRHRETGLPANRIIEASFYYYQEQSDGRPPIIGQSEVDIKSIKKRYPKASIKIGRWTDEETWSRVERTALQSKWE